MDREHQIAEALAGAAVRAFVAEGDPFVISHTLQVTSLGGSGTTALSASFIDAGLDMPPGPGQWPHKHHRVPPDGSAVPDGFRVVYPIGDPRDAVMSVFRRGIQGGHWRALHHAGPNVALPVTVESLEAMLAGGVDEFGLADHLDRWLNHPPGYPVMFVRFDLIDEAWDEVAAFVGLPETAPRLSYGARSSDWRSAEPHIRDGLDALYGDLAARIASMPAVRVV